jgi:hypothetical protein
MVPFARGRHLKHYSVIASPGIEPGYVVIPSHKNNVQFIVGRTAKKFLAVSDYVKLMS